MIEARYLVTIRNDGEERILSRSEVESILLDYASRWEAENGRPAERVSVEVVAA